MVAVQDQAEMGAASSCGTADPVILVHTGLPLMDGLFEDPGGPTCEMLRALVSESLTKWRSKAGDQLSFFTNQVEGRTPRGRRTNSFPDQTQIYKMENEHQSVIDPAERRLMVILQRKVTHEISKDVSLVEPGIVSKRKSWPGENLVIVGSGGYLSMIQKTNSVSSSGNEQAFRPGSMSSRTRDLRERRA